MPLLGRRACGCVKDTEHRRAPCLDEPGPRPNRGGSLGRRHGGASCGRHAGGPTVAAGSPAV
eukprot:7675293-Lingulodinium_polyedra.AAC.1